jgi:hypothetical protein
MAEARRITPCDPDERDAWGPGELAQVAALFETLLRWDNEAMGRRDEIRTDDPPVGAG